MSEVTININSLISELKIEVHQCDCCKNLDAHLEMSTKLKNLVLESLLKAVSSARDTCLETSDLKHPNNEPQKKHH